MHKYRLFEIDTHDNLYDTGIVVECNEANARDVVFVSYGFDCKYYNCYAVYTVENDLVIHHSYGANRYPCWKLVKGQ